MKERIEKLLLKLLQSAVNFLKEFSVDLIRSSKFKNFKSLLFWGKKMLF